MQGELAEREAALAAAEEALAVLAPDVVKMANHSGGGEAARAESSSGWQW